MPRSVMKHKYDKMKKKDIPCGHYWKWVKYHNKKMEQERIRAAPYQIRLRNKEAEKAMKAMKAKKA